MDLKIILGIITLSILLFVIGMFLPSDRVVQQQSLPWQIESSADGSSRVFGLRLGQTTLREAEVQLQAAAEVSLFAGDDRHVVEAYFDKLNVGGLSARAVLVMDIARPELLAMYRRGTRISTLGSGANKVSLSDVDLAQVMQMPIASLTYLPRTALDEALLVKRFGQPVQRIMEAETNTEHWLYPQLGLDIARDENGHAVFQYVRPLQFSSVLEPLQNLHNNK